MTFVKTAAVAVAALGLSICWAAAEDMAYGIAMHGEPMLTRGDPLPYVNPEAPSGGTITYGVLGSFDSLNPAIPRGAKPPGLRDPLYGDLVYQSLLDRNRAEPFSLYGMLADGISVPDDRSSITFHIDPNAAFSDGHPVTADDVIFTLELLREQGWPYARNYYNKVESYESPDPQTVTFRFPNANDRELPLILGLMPIFPEHDTDPETFGQTTLDPPVGTGPYVVADVQPGRSITYQKDPDFWGKDNPLNVGRYNADTIKFEFYRDATALFEAFKTGKSDVFLEGDPARWSEAYNFPAVRDGRVTLDTIETGTPRGMFAFVMNGRRPPFDDIRVREAMNLLFDFEWVNRELFFGLMTRTDSFFTNSDLASTGRPASEAERAMLASFPDAVRDDVMDGTWRPSTSDGSGRDRTKLRAAAQLLAEAGYRVQDGVLRDAEGRPFAFEILVSIRDDERLALTYSRFLRPLGIEAAVRFVDAQQYQARMLVFDFDMARVYWPASLSPGNEQTHRWTADAADVEGSFNYAGARDPAIKAMIAEMLAAEDRPDFEDAVRALDRVLLSGFYVIPLYHSPEQWVAYSTRLDKPDTQSLSGVELETWWVRQ